MLGRINALVLGVVLLTLGSIPARGQIFASDWGGVPLLGVLARYPQGVASELGMSAAQREQVRKLLPALWDKHHAELERHETLLQRDLDLPQRANALRVKQAELQKALRTEAEAGLAEALKPEQLARLRQLDVQADGLLALLFRADVKSALALTDAQVEKIQAIQDELQDEIDKYDDDTAKAHRERKRKALERAAAVLNDEQKKKWSDLTGPAVNYKSERPLLLGPPPNVLNSSSKLMLVTAGQFLRAGPLLDELKLTETQVVQVRDRAEAVVKKQSPELEKWWTETAKLGQPLDRQVMAQLYEKTNELTRITIPRAIEQSLPDLLRPEQIRRIQQARWQQLGLGAFADPDVQKALGLSDEQKAKLLAIRREHDSAMIAATQDAFNKEKFDLKVPANGAERRHKAMEQALAVLTAAQRETWKELLGAPLRH